MSSNQREQRREQQPPEASYQASFQDQGVSSAEVNTDSAAQSAPLVGNALPQPPEAAVGAAQSAPFVGNALPQPPEAAVGAANKVSSMSRKLSAHAACASDSKADSAGSRTATRKKIRQKPRKFEVSAEMLDAWFAKIKTIQSSKMTPEIRAQIKSRAIRQRSALIQARKCKKLASARRSMKRGFSSALSSMRSAKAPRSALPPSTRDQSQRQAQHIMMEQISSSAAAARQQLSCVRESIAELSDDNDDVFGDYGAAAQSVASSMDGGSSLLLNNAVEIAPEMLLADEAAEEMEIAEEIDESEMDKLLSELRNEPDTDEEREAKFGLFEVYLETVTKLREETLRFWQESKQEFLSTENPAAPSNAVRLIEASIRRIDRAHNMGMQNFGEGSVWFVHGMCKKASKNSAMIDEVLRSIRTKLDLLSQQIECPICFEEFDENHIPQILSCCHACCDSCWAHWKRARQSINAVVYCPLCRNDEFVCDIVGGQ